MSGYDTLHNIVGTEFTQAREEGRDPEGIEKLRSAYKHAGADPIALNSVYESLTNVPLTPGFPYDEPNTLEAIRARRANGPRDLSLNYGDDELYYRLYGAWLGRCAGCALGKPVEAFLFTHNGLTSKERQKTYLLGIGPQEYPLHDYFKAHSPAEGQTGTLWGGQSTREVIAYMESDDDLRYTVLGQIVLTKMGADFTTLDIVSTWMNTLPYNMVCTAETQAYRNLVSRYPLHTATLREEDVDWNWVATHQNPYREWIGAQIRADSWGYAVPGNPERAAEFAWRDARLSHVKNGIYGEMFCAAMVAAAFAHEAPLQIVEAGLAEIPQTSRLYAAIQEVIAICHEYGYAADSYEQVHNAIYDRLGHYHAVHTINNAALVVAALLLCERDFEKAITLAVMGGWDTDCNGATVGSIVGAMLGARRLPDRWIAPLHDTLNSQIIDYHPIAISQCARRSHAIARKLAASKQE